MLEKMGYANVKTLLASGNVVFETQKSSIPALIAAIETQFEKTFGFTSSIILRPLEEIRKLIASDPFKGITVTPQTRLYVTFLLEKPKSTLKIPYVSESKDFKILRVTDHEICSVLTISDNTNSIDSMNILEKEFGKRITTRNWNTVLKLVKEK